MPAEPKIIEEPPTIVVPDTNEQLTVTDSSTTAEPATTEQVTVDVPPPTDTCPDPDSIISSKVKKLNNMVNELINFDIPAPPDRDYLDCPFYTFNFERDHAGWIYIKIDSDQITEANNIIMTLDDDPANVVLNSNDMGTYNTYNGSIETMRYVAAGVHKAKLMTKGAPSIKNVIIRSIPTIVIYQISFLNPNLLNPNNSASQYTNVANFTWDKLTEMGVLKNFNTISADYRPKTDLNYPDYNNSLYNQYIDEWRKRGGHWLANMQLVNWENNPPSKWENLTETQIKYNLHEIWKKAMEEERYDGITMDEFGITPGQIVAYPMIPQFLTDLRNSPKTKDKLFMALSSTYCYNNEEDKKSGLFGVFDGIFEGIFSNGFKIVPEVYSDEENQFSLETWKKNNNTGDLFDYHWKKYDIEENLLPCVKRYPDYVKNSIFQFGTSDYVNASPWYMQNINPSVDFKVQVEKEMHGVATDPEFDGLYGVSLYALSYMSENTLAWFSDLSRHYLIEGNQNKLGSDPYETTHITNPGFENGIAIGNGWNINPAFSGSISTLEADKDANGNYIPNTFYNTLGVKKWLHAAVPERNIMLKTKRSNQKANRISQTIKSLVPGRLYDLKYFTMDKNNFKEANEIKTSVKIEGAELIPDKSSDAVILFGKGGGSDTSFKDKNGSKVAHCWNIHYRVFKALSNSATLTFSDWPVYSKDKGEIGQEILWDFIEVNPYYGK